MTTSIGPTYDPASTASALATKYTSGAQALLTAQTQQANALDKGLADLESALLAFQGSLESLTGLNQTMLTTSATFSDTSVGSASATASATAGSYSLFVEQLATASQIAYGGLTDTTPVAGDTIGIQFGGASAAITIDLQAAAGADGVLSTRDLAAAINGSSQNTSLVSASVITVNGADQLVLTAKNTGAASALTLDTSNVTEPTLAGELADPANFRETVAAQDAVVWLGPQGTGLKMQQASNTFTSIAGVTMNFTRAQAAGSAPVTLTVGTDTAGTTSKVQSLVEAYNKLKSALDAMTDAGDPSKGKAAGVFASDGGIRALRDRLVSLMRPAVGASLAAYGIVAARDGTLSVNSARLARQLAADPTGLDALIGSSSSSAPTGIAGSLDTYVKSWSDSASGQVKKRQDVNGRLETQLTARQSVLDDQYNAAYQRYLLQFSQLQALQSQMSSNTSMFDALFGNNKSN